MPPRSTVQRLRSSWLFCSAKPLTELAFARRVGEWLKSEPENRSALELAAAYATWATLAPAGQRRHGDGILFKLPHKIDRMNSIPLQPVIKDGVTVLKGSGDRQRHRDGFRLTDGGASFAHALDQANYCIWCHNQGKDSCSQGLRNRKNRLLRARRLRRRASRLPAGSSASPK